MRYYACLPISEADKELSAEIENRVSNVQSIEELKESGFLDLLETGEYEFEVFREKETTLLFNTNLYNSNETIHWMYKKQTGKSRRDISHFLNIFYPTGFQLMFTQPIETLNTERIKFYEDKIKKGERPFAIAIRARLRKHGWEDSYDDTIFNSTKYILDGHHKLVAYQNLDIKPSFILINKISKDYDESPLPTLPPYLYYQRTDIFKILFLVQ